MSDAGGSGNHEPGQARRSEEAALSRRLHDLDQRLGKRRSDVESAKPVEQAARPGFALALRLGADFVAGVVVGAALGWGFDALLGTSPWGLIAFLLFGFAAGVLSVLRTAGLAARRPELDDPASRRLDGRG
jgi:ATP synthase protein I